MGKPWLSGSKSISGSRANKSQCHMLLSCMWVAMVIPPVHPCHVLQLDFFSPPPVHVTKVDTRLSCVVSDTRCCMGTCSKDRELPWRGKRMFYFSFTMPVSKLKTVTENCFKWCRPLNVPILRSESLWGRGSKLFILSSVFSKSCFDGSLLPLFIRSIE